MTTHMRREIDEIPAVLDRLAAPEAQEEIARLAGMLRSRDPGLVLTIARGSSDHMALSLKYAIELTLRLPVASLGPSLVTVYGVAPRPRQAVALAFSQSGGSADIVALTEALSSSGTPVFALTNTPESPLGRAADGLLDVRAGPERAVAATKSAVATLVAGLWLVALWAEDTPLAAALRTLADTVRGAEPNHGWEAASHALQASDRAMVIGRGPALGLAHEMALKLLETCGIHAMAYSAAEVLHGPNAVLTDGIPVLALTAGSGSAVDGTVARLAGQGANVLRPVALHPPVHPLVDPILELIAFYGMVEALSRARGRDPDAPAFLVKATSTL
ncbi:MAG: SIS domain-containing protein [Pseudomonadota bacterium]